MNNRKKVLDCFLSDYWKYYLSLEKRLIQVSQYIEFVHSMRNAYSRELLGILQTVGSEVDVCGKSIAEYYHPDDPNIPKAHIARWGYVLQSEFPSLSTQLVKTPLNEKYAPWSKWGNEPYKDKNGKQGYRLKERCENPEWWRAYNATKHRRKSLIREGDSSFERASLQNAINSLAGLYVLEAMFVMRLSGEMDAMHSCKSTLFCFVD